MPASASRTAAFDVLLAVETKDAYASELLHADAYANLNAADHRLATEIVMGVLRWQSLLDAQIAQHVSQNLAKLDVEALIVLRMGTYQLQFLDRVPARAAVHESVELIKRARKRSAAPFVNAVLRKIQQAKKTDPDSTIAQSTNSGELANAAAHSLWLVERWARQFGFDRTKQICRHDQHVPQASLRVTDSSIVQELEAEGIELAPGRLLRLARIVLKGDVTATQAFRERRVFIQDEASQLVALLVGEGQQILDCCAAPGGKTRILAERNPQSKILAMELHPHRVTLLRKMIPFANVEVVTADAANMPASERFDRVLADVPCSGTGTLARNPEIKWRLTEADLADLQSRQEAILRSAAQQLAPGGKLIYSTCSLEPEENVAVVEYALSQQKDMRLFDCRQELQRLIHEGELAWLDVESLLQGSYLRTIPGIHPCDGFFAAVITRE